MTRIDRSALVMHSAAQMYGLVNDVASYPEFLPWCPATEVLQQSATEMLAKVSVAKAGLKYSFTTRNTLIADEKIVLTLIEGPFKSMTGEWSFKALDEGACKVSLQLNFEFTGKLTGMAMAKVFNQIALAMIDAFCARADDIYGKQAGA